VFINVCFSHIVIIVSIWLPDVLMLLTLKQRGTVDIVIVCCSIWL